MSFVIHNIDNRSNTGLLNLWPRWSIFIDSVTIQQTLWHTGTAEINKSRLLHFEVWWVNSWVSNAKQYDTYKLTATTWGHAKSKKKELCDWLKEMRAILLACLPLKSATSPNIHILNIQTHSRLLALWVPGATSEAPSEHGANVLLFSASRKGSILPIEMMVVWEKCLLSHGPVWLFVLPWFKVTDPWEHSATHKCSQAPFLCQPYGFHYRRKLKSVVGEGNEARRG